MRTTLQLSDHPAFLVVDVQRDFCAGGSLPVEHGDEIIAPLNRLLAKAQAVGMPVYASRDWHPAVTSHFKAYGGEWPPHCVQGTTGAEFHPDLSLPEDVTVVSAGDDPDRPGYSAFEGHTHDGKPFLEDLQRRGIDELLVAGLATDYCVKESVLDARRSGLRVVVLLDAVAGIDVRPGDVDRALAEMSGAGAELASDVEGFVRPEGRPT